MKKYIIFLALFISMQVVAQNAINPKVLIKKGGITYISEKDKLYPIDGKSISVKLKPGMKVDNKFRIERQNKLGYMDIQIPDNVDVEKFAIELDESNCFDVIEYNSIGEYYASSNDPYANQQWYLSVIGVNSAWNITQGNSNVKVAVLDSGVDCAHSDLGYGNDSYKNIEESLGWNFETNNNNVNTGEPHGTNVAGIIAAKTNNLHGISGIAGGYGNTGVTIIPYCIGASGPINSILDDAIIDAVDKGAKIINLSLGVAPTFAIEAAITYASSNNVTIVCASGNNNSSTIAYPASNQHTIAVGAIDKNYQRFQNSRYGIGLDLVAPGIDIYTTTLNNSYVCDYGTSLAAPQVTGVVALMLSVNSSLTPDNIRNILRNTANKISGYTYTNGWNDEVGYGLLDAYAAVNIAAIGTPSPSMVVYPISADGEWGYWRSDLHGNKIEVDGYSGNYPSYVVDLYRINNDFSIGQQVGHWTRNSLDNMTFGYYPPGWYYIEIVGVNDCGTSSPVGTEIESVDGSWGQPRMFSFNYNQGSEMLTVTLNPALGSRQAVNSCEIQLWNGNTMLRKFRMTDGKLQIPMSGMKDGLYIIRVIKDGKTQQRKLIVK